jgi:hypothetical protein
VNWSYHFVVKPDSSKPQYYINAFTKWNPDEAINIFEGVLRGEKSETFNFEFVSPQKAGCDTIRVFFASSHAPMRSYYGHPGANMLTAPASAPYIEIPIEVVAK